MKNLVKTRGRRLVIDYLSIFLHDLEQLGNQVRDVASNEHIWAEVKRVDLFTEVYDKFVRNRQQSGNRLTGPESHHTGPQITGVEGYIDTRQRDP